MSRRHAVDAVTEQTTASSSLDDAAISLLMRLRDGSTGKQMTPSVWERPCADGFPFPFTFPRDEHRHQPGSNASSPAAVHEPATRRVVFPAGSTYQGAVDRDTKSRHGHGRWQNHDASAVYVGEWRQGRKEGYGTMSYLTGRYIGDWLQDIPDGHGTLVYHGMCYEGTVQAGRMAGRGRLQYPNGDHCEGEWMADKKGRSGCMCYANGDVYDWHWVTVLGTGDGLLVYANGDRQEGRLTFPDGSVYSGEFRDNQFHGRGLYLDRTNHCAYEGEWKDGKMHGQGTMTYETGDRWEGRWVEDKRVAGAFVFAADASP
eukprot:GGOE01002517.1.p1 GENE.GGOE01002517.1~~GGOE01002517.1.p1  ORF type:complete len:315 (+),score=31.96 GGOE01002517.1:110-1054(+)